MATRAAFYKPAMSSRRPKRYLVSALLLPLSPKSHLGMSPKRVTGKFTRASVPGHSRQRFWRNREMLAEYVSDRKEVSLCPNTRARAPFSLHSPLLGTFYVLCRGWKFKYRTALTLCFLFCNNFVCMCLHTTCIWKDVHPK